MSNMNVTVQDGNNITVEVVPVARQTIEISRGVKGDPGPNSIGGYPISLTNVQSNDALMFGVGAWVNIPQTEISDGGNY